MNKSTTNNMRGATMLEFVIGFPLLVLLIMFLIDSGLYLFQKSIVTDVTARINRAIVTQLGQREAEAANCAALHASCTGSMVMPPDCDELILVATEKKTEIESEKTVLFEHTGFKLKVESQAEIPFRLITTTGTREYQCLLCKFFPAGILNIVHRSVLVIERPDFTGLSTHGCTSLTPPKPFN